MEVLGIKTKLMRTGDDLVDLIQTGMKNAGLSLENGDVLVLAESVVATWEGRVTKLTDVVPGTLAMKLARKYDKDPREMQLIIQESDHIMGGIPGVILTIKDGFLYPNAGIDHSNAPLGHVVLFPKDPQRSAFIIKKRLEKAYGKKIGVIIGDSRTHPLRLGCVGVALACEGLIPVEDARGQKDLYGRPLEITRKAVADNLTSAAQIVMGEGDEGIPAVIIRGSPIKLVQDSDPEPKKMVKIPSIAPEECMYIGALKGGPHPYTGGYDDLIADAKRAMMRSYAPYSHFKVGAALLGRSGKVYTGGNVENASSSASICAERAAISRAISEGEDEFQALAIVGDSTEPVAPCGVCRQTLLEFGEDVTVIMANTEGKVIEATAVELLPNAFTKRFLDII